MKIELKDVWPGVADIEFTGYYGDYVRETLEPTDAEEFIIQLETVAKKLRYLYGVCK